MWTLFLAAFAWGAAGEAVPGDEKFWTEEGQLYPMLPIAVTSTQNELCRSDGELLVQHLRNKSLWAMTMWDSSAKAPVGILHGNIFQLGNFDECLRVASPIKAQFCVAQVFADVAEGYHSPENPYNLHMNPDSSVWSMIRGSRIDPSQVPRDVINWGLCVPASCSNRDLEKGINAYLQGRTTAANETVYRVRIGEEFCTSADERDDVTVGEIAFWSFAVLLVILTVCGTALDFVRGDNAEGSKCSRLLNTFSLKRNVPKLCGSTEESSGGNQMNILYGLKALSIVPIIFGHRIGIDLSLSATNAREIEEHLRTGGALFFVHTDLVVDTFFFIGGLLVCSFLMKIYEVRWSGLNPILAIVTRLTRLAPIYFFIIWYQASAANRLGSGPLWKAIAKTENKFCAENWWTNVLFLNNYIKPKEMCMPHSWYIPCDLHFFVLASVLVILLVKHRKTGLLVLSALIIVSAVIPALVTYVNQIQPMIIFFHDFLSNPRENETFSILYVKSHNRATVYFIGMAVGYFLHTHKDSAKRTSKTLVVSSFFLWLLLMFSPMVYGSLYYNSERPYHVVESAVFSSLRRISWAIAFSIFILGHRYGTIPILDKALSSRPAVFLSNITYGIYLIHFNLITADVSQTRFSKTFRISHAILDGVGDYFLSAFFSTILSLILDMPSKRILREVVLAKKIQNLKKQMDSADNKNMSVYSVTVESSYTSNSAS